MLIIKAIAMVFNRFVCSSLVKIFSKSFLSFKKTIRFSTLVALNFGRFLHERCAVFNEYISWHVMVRKTVTFFDLLCESDPK